MMDARSSEKEDVDAAVFFALEWFVARGDEGGGNGTYVGERRRCRCFWSVCVTRGCLGGYADDAADMVCFPSEITAPDQSRQDESNEYPSERMEAFCARLLRRARSFFRIRRFESRGAFSRREGVCLGMLPPRLSRRIVRQGLRRYCSSSETIHTYVLPKGRVYDILWVIRLIFRSSMVFQPFSPSVQRPPETDDEDVYGVGRFLWEIVKVFILAFVIIIPIRVFFFQPFFVQGSSMEPNFQDGQYLIIGELGYKKTDVNLFGSHLFSVDPSKDLRRQETVVFHPPSTGSSGQFFIKRVIGLPGETVEIKNSRVIIRNAAHPEGFVLDESAYLNDSVQTFVPNGGSAFSVKLKENEYFLMGDNRMYSHDSRSFGPVSNDRMIGRVVLRAWPLEKTQLY